MKTIEIPKDIQILDENNEPKITTDGLPFVVSFVNFVKNTLLVDPKFGRSMETILSAVEIRNKLSNTTDSFELDKADWERLLEVTNEPTGGYNPAIVVQLVPFLLAIKNAK